MAAAVAMASCFPGERLADAPDRPEDADPAERGARAGRKHLRPRERSNVR
jgi:hypothetical protein